MQLTNINFREHKLKEAKSKLDQHKTLGSKSNLSIFEVARLMDMIKSENESGDTAYNFTLSLN